ncbi:hypothetical protein OM960_22830 [Defluviimonas sp. CAU 1641]|uniref:Uncharacterized protein n=1 Tax=Defluviimonas salinarum TaxID=2992147 RepID=A0ABT3J9J7_9RHOB|nr:hypothetical protein [Defluviimonas salinarum]
MKHLLTLAVALTLGATMSHAEGAMEQGLIDDDDAILEADDSSVDGSGSAETDADGSGGFVLAQTDRHKGGGESDSDGSDDSDDDDGDDSDDDGDDSDDGGDDSDDGDDSDGRDDSDD